jgi:putative NIF3 family GTP cyclohydrolase 1 type 2
VKRLVAGHLVFDAIRRGVAIYSPHTALDVADGGTNDVLADAIGLGNRAPLRLTAETKANQYKLVTFVPEKTSTAVSQALFEAGRRADRQVQRVQLPLAGHGDVLRRGRHESRRRRERAARAGRGAARRNGRAGGEDRSGDPRAAVGPPVRGAGL